MVKITTSLDQKHKDTAKKYLVKNKTYTLAAYLFAFAGLFVFVVLYIKFVDGEAMNFIHDPMLFLILFAPFIPALWLFMAAKKAKIKAASVIKKVQEAAK